MFFGRLGNAVVQWWPKKLGHHGTGILKATINLNLETEIKYNVIRNVLSLCVLSGLLAWVRQG